MQKIRGSHVLITGAARGIGRAVALELATRGARLELVDLDESGLKSVREEAVERGALAASVARVDVSDAAAVEDLARRVLARTGPLDALINAAGVAVFGPVLDTDEELWRHVLEINLLGTVRCTRAFAPSMVERGRGQIVNVASASAFCAVPGLGAYATTKYAVLGLSEALRSELAASGVGVS
ncbi:MAG TPA: SDR family NAD(P)-dependent oxidoreductase, partial [Polyangiaceae bacterium]|nr:SDR family NAD(P)-dependent oxidoreductase [Polyangiaceae bacterium]